MEEKQLDVGELIIAIQSAVSAFAEEQIRMNNLPPSFGSVIIKGVYANFLQKESEQNALSKVTVNPPQKAPEVESRVVTGTPAELLAAFAETGFKEERKGD